MTQLISNVLMQPKPDAVERPLTLVEKLGNRHKEWSLNTNYWMDDNLIRDVFNDVIKIVKQHSEWVSVNERLPSESDHYLCYCFNGDYWCQEVNFFDREIKRFCNYDEDVKFWRELPQPPSEVQDD